MKYGRVISNTYCRHAARWEAGGAAAPPDFGGSVNPISTRGGDTLSPPSTTYPPGFLTLAACLRYGTIDDPGGILPQI